MAGEGRMPQAARVLEAGSILPAGALSAAAGQALAAIETGLLAVAQVLARGDEAAVAPVFGAAVAGRVRLILNGQAVEGPEGAPVLAADLPDGRAPGPRGAILALHAGAPGSAPVLSAVAVWGARLTVAATAGAGEGVWIAGADPAAGSFAAPLRLAALPGGAGRLAVDPAGWDDWPRAAQAHYLAALRDGQQPVWSGSLAAEVLGLLTGGGLCLMPGATLPAPTIGAVAALLRAAGGLAEGPALSGAAGGGLLLGSAAAVARMRAAGALAEAEPASALFGHRGLFRS